MATIKISGLTHLEVIKVMEALGRIQNINFDVPQINGGKLTPQKRGEEVTIRRIDFIYGHFCTLVNGDKELTQERLFRYALRRGYQKSRKTFTGDVKMLEVQGKIARVVISGGKHGKRTILKEPDRGESDVNIG